MTRCGFDKLALYIAVPALVGMVIWMVVMGN